MLYERLYIEISNICNLQCTFCPVVERDKKIMSLEDFRKTAKQAKPLAKQICLHLMGEPLAHPQFGEIMQVCDELDLRIFLTTNGTLIKKHAEALLSWKSLDQINFSIHSYFANPTRVALEQYLSPILGFSYKASEAKKDFYINLRLWNLENPRAQKENNLSVLNEIENKFNVELNTNVDIKMHKSKKIMHKTYVHFDTEFEWPTLKREVMSTTGTCYGLRKQLAIHANGDVVPCCLDKEALLKLGNVHESTIHDVVNSPKAKSIRQGFERGELIEELCQKCQYVERFR